MALDNMAANKKSEDSSGKRDKRSLRLAFQIVNEIGQRKFEKGQMLPSEHEMLEHYGVARATLREALRFLELQGVIKLRPGPGGGPVVLEPKPENFASAMALLLQFTGAEYRSLIEVRQAISSGMAAYAAERASQTDVERLQDSLNRLKSLEGSSREYVEENRKFHDLLALAGQNPLMVFLVVGLHQITNSSSLGICYTDSERSYQINAYERILSAIVKRDPEMASSEMGRFMLRSDRYLEKRYPDLMSKRIRWSDGARDRARDGAKLSGTKSASQHVPIGRLKRKRKQEVYMALRSRVSEMLGIKYPILLAGMGGASVPRLAAAVSNAGGLGVLGAAACPPEQLREWIRETRSLTDKPFGVDTLLPASVRRGTKPQSGGGDLDPMELLGDYRNFARDFMAKEKLESTGASSIVADTGSGKQNKERPGSPQFFSKEFFEAQMEVVVEEKVAVYAAGLGNPGPWIDRLHANGTKVMAVVGAVKHAVQVVNSGIDLIVAQGHDGGGHNSPIGTMALIPQVVDAINGRIPVLGAGGISDGRGIAAAFMLGAEGAWIGTTFLATNEAGIEDFQKEVIVDSGDGDTVVSRSVTGKPARIIRNKWSQAWVEAKKEPLPMPFQSIVAGPVLAAAMAAKRKDIAPGFAGQGMGLVKKIRPAAEVMKDLVAEAEKALSSARQYA